jgi:hypothetical protein
MDGVLERLQSFDIPSMFASKAWPNKARPGPTKQGLVEMETGSEVCGFFGGRLKPHDS